VVETTHAGHISIDHTNTKKKIISKMEFPEEKKK
jgi:hypothetical protein